MDRLLENARERVIRIRSSVEFHKYIVPFTCRKFNSDKLGSH